MSRSAHVRGHALRDVRQIRLRIAADNPSAARRFLIAFRSTCSHLAMMPGLGSIFESPSSRYPLLRVLGIPKFANYLIFYFETPDGIDVLRVLYAGMDLQVELAGS